MHFIEFSVLDFHGAPIETEEDPPKSTKRGRDLETQPGSDTSGAGMAGNRLPDDRVVAAEAELEPLAARALPVKSDFPGAVFATGAAVEVAQDAPPVGAADERDGLQLGDDGLLTTYFPRVDDNAVLVAESVGDRVPREISRVADEASAPCRPRPTRASSGSNQFLMTSTSGASGAWIPQSRPRRRTRRARWSPTTSARSRLSRRAPPPAQNSTR